MWQREIGGQFLIERTGRAEYERVAAEALSAALGGLPLAHEMAGSYCERIGTSFAEYQRRFGQAPARLLDSDIDAPAEYHDRLTVAKTFALAIDEAAKLHRAADPLIVHAALLAPEPIPLFLFFEGREKFGEPFAAQLADGGVDEAVAALRAFGLVDCELIPDERDPAITTETIRLHRLVREVAAARIEGKARDAPLAALIEAMAAVYPRDVDDDPRTWPRARRLDSVAMALCAQDAGSPKGVEAAASHLMDRLASYRRAVLAAYAEAESLYRRALAIDETSLGPDHPNVATSLNNLAGLLRATNRLAEAEPLYRRALAIGEVSLGPDHSAIGIRCGNLAGLLQDTNRLGEAEPLYRRGLAIHEASLGPKHPYVAIGLSNLAVLLKATNRHGEAEPLLRRALAIDEASLGQDHPSVAIRLNNLAGLLQDTNRPGEAEPFYRRALAICEASLGPDHPNTVMVRENLAALLARGS